MKYYEVKAKCGHVGRLNCIYIKFAIYAQDGKEAASKARFFPRVKHDHKDAIKYVKEITKEEYKILLQNNNEDEYLNCKSKREQNQIENFYLRIEDDEYNLIKYDKEKTRDVECKIKKNAIKEKFWKKVICDYKNEFNIEIA